MNNVSTLTIRTLTVLLVVTSMVFSASLLPELFSSNAESRIDAAPAAAESGLPNFDIRTDRDAGAELVLANIRSAAGRDMLTVDTVRGRIAEGEAALRAQ